AVVGLGLSTGAGRNTMAIDAGGIQIAVALTAACRTPVANLGILCRNSDTAILVMKASEPRHSRFHPSRVGTRRGGRARHFGRARSGTQSPASPATPEMPIKRGVLRSP